MARQTFTTGQEVYTRSGYGPFRRCVVMTPDIERRMGYTTEHRVEVRVLEGYAIDSVDKIENNRRYIITKERWEELEVLKRAEVEERAEARRVRDEQVDQLWDRLADELIVMVGQGPVAERRSGVVWFLRKNFRLAYDTVRQAEIR